MSFAELNDALQRATPAGHWIFWRGDTALVANSHASTELGRADEPLEELLWRIPDMCDIVDALKADKMEQRGF